MNKKMNKKGFVGSLLILLVLVIVVIVLTISKPYLMAGMLFILLSLGLGFKFAKGNKGTGLVLLGILLGVGIIFAPSLGLVEQKQFETGYFEAPFYATIKCDLAQGPSRTSGVIDIPEGGGIVRCPENTKSCDVLVTVESRGYFTTTRRIAWQTCNRLGSDCSTRFITPSESTPGISDDGVIDLKIFSNMPSNELIRINLVKPCYNIQKDCDDGYKSVSDKITAKTSYNAYVLKINDRLDGGETTLNSESCKIPISDESWLNRIVSSTVKSVNGKDAKLESDAIILNGNLEPDETYNYISGTVTRALVGNTIQYEGKTAFCQENIQGTELARIYGIGEIETATNKYRIVDFNNRLAEVDCCVEGRIQLNRQCVNYRWVPVTVNADGTTDVECSNLKPCTPGVLPLYSQKSSFEFQCVDGFCKVTNIQPVDCTKTTDCNTDQVCVNFKCVNTSPTPNAAPAKDKVKEILSASDCPTGTKFVQKQSTNPSILNKIGIGKAPVITENSCEPLVDPLSIIIIAIVVIMIIVIIILLIGGNKQNAKLSSKRRN